MSIILLEGFETGVEVFVQYSGASSDGYVIASTDPRSGSYNILVDEVGTSGAELNGATVSVDCTAGDKLIVGFAFRTTAIDSAKGSYWTPIASIHEVGRANLHSLMMKDTGHLAVIASRETIPRVDSILYTAQASTKPITADTWHYIEFESSINNTTGELVVYVDSTEVINFTGDTDLSYNGTETDVRDIYFFGPNSSANSQTHEFDDIYVIDADDATGSVAALGPVSIEMLTPTSQTTGDFLGSDSNSTDNHLLVDERPVSDTDYVESATAADRDLYGWSDRTLTGDVIAIAPVVVALNSDTGTVALDLVISSNSTESQTAAKNLSGSAEHLTEIYPNDPDTAAAWTTSGVNALLAGFEVS